jgi:hypothetical protein
VQSVGRIIAGCRVTGHPCDGFWNNAIYYCYHPEAGGFVVTLIVTSYLMYDDIPARPYRNIIVEPAVEKI